MASRVNCLAVVTETKMRHNVWKALQYSHEKCCSSGQTTKTFDKWLKHTLLEWYKQDKFNVEAYEEGTEWFYFALVCSEHLEKLYPDERFPKGPLQWFKNRRLNSHLRHPTFSVRPDPALPRKVQTSQGQTRLFETSAL